MNPYEAPRAAAGELDFDEVMRRDLRIVARMQKLVILSILGNLALFGLALLGSLAKIDAVLLVVRVASLALVAVQLYAVFNLATRLYGRGIGVFATLGMFIPCFSLVVLLMLNGAATKKLREAGIQVGFFGANLAAVP